MQQIIQQAVAVLQAGGTLLYPTDTIWGIGCDAANPDAVEKIYRIKQRDHSKSMLILATEQMLAPTLPDAAAELLLHSDRPTTVILPAQFIATPLAPNLLASDGTIGVRMPHHDFCQQLLAAFGRPIVSTSANFSGQPSPQHYEDIAEELKVAIDYCVPDLPQFESGETQGSRIIKLTPEGPIVLRP